MDPNTLSLQALLAATWPFIQQKLKNSDFPLFAWISSNTPKINASISALVALLTTAGWHFAGDLIHGGMVTFPPLMVWAKALAVGLMQHGVYKQFIAGPEVQKAILAELQKANSAPQKLIAGPGVKPIA